MISGLTNINNNPFTLAVNSCPAGNDQPPASPQRTENPQTPWYANQEGGVRVIINHYHRNLGTRTDSFDAPYYVQNREVTEEEMNRLAATQVPVSSFDLIDIDKAKEKVADSALRSLITKAANTLFEKVTGLQVPSKIVSSALGSAMGNVINPGSHNETEVNPSPHVIDYLLKYGCSGAINGLVSALLTPLINVSPLPAWSAAAVNRVTGLGVTQQRAAEVLSTIAGAGSGAALNTVAANKGIIPQPKPTKEYGWMIEGLGGGFSMAMQLLVYTRMQKLLGR